ncbi:MAG: hypothetical protein V2I74_01010 [Erythrobacter sp.]|nr:hypothetical protein [Erythrobacter sp.]
MLAAVSAAPVAGQERIPIDIGPATGDASPPAQIDILAPPPVPDAPTAAETLECDSAADAGEISNEIVVCRSISDASQLYAGSHEAWLADYAERTRYHNAPRTPDLAGEGIFRGPPSVSGLCFIPPCPRDPALLIDVAALPPPPVDSDAWWQARGITPRNRNGKLTAAARRILEAELVLPPRPDFSSEADR